jgi:hypothetical protein
VIGEEFGDFSKANMQVSRDAKVYYDRSFLSRFFSQDILMMLQLQIMTTNFRPHGLTTYPGLKQRYRLARTEHYEANARRLVEMCLTNLADGQKEKGQGNIYTSDNNVYPALARNPPYRNEIYT